MDWKPGNSYKITYRSESGRLSVRTIDIISTSPAPEGQLYLGAYCHLRNEERTFRSDRVICTEKFAARQDMPSRVPAPVCASILPAEPARNPGPSLGSRAQKTVSDFLVNVLGYGFGAIMVFTMLGNSGILDVLASSPLYKPTAYAPAVMGSRPVPSPSPPKPAVEDLAIGGQVLRIHRSGGTERYEVPSVGFSTNDKREAVAFIRIPRFIKATGISHPELARRYLAADLDASGRLSFAELEVFQKKTYQEFRYGSNELALRPDEFLEAGGGDCEDYALYTAGLLRFWGWDPYLGSFGPSGSGIGHAVCLSYEEGSFPGPFTYFEVTSWTADDGTPLKPGRYVPIDYDKVGGLTNAVEKGWTLRSIYVPEKAWGLRM
jgi:hypothetical protein